MNLIHYLLLFIMGTLGACTLWAGSLALKRAGKQQQIKKFRRVTLILSTLVTLLLVVLEWEWRTHRVELDWKEEVTIHIKGFEREAFLDNPTDFDFYLYNAATTKKLSFDFSHPDWTAFKFYKMKEQPNWLAIEDQSMPVYWVINWSTMEFQNRTTEFLKDQPWELVEVATLTPFYRFELNK